MTPYAQYQYQTIHQSSRNDCDSAVFPSKGAHKRFADLLASAQAAEFKLHILEVEARMMGFEFLDKRAFQEYKTAMIVSSGLFQALHTISTDSGPLRSEVNRLVRSAHKIAQKFPYFRLMQERPLDPKNPNQGWDHYSKQIEQLDAKDDASAKTAALHAFALSYVANDLPKITLPGSVRQEQKRNRETMSNFLNNTPNKKR